ncbi:MAG: TonB-dependent receptor plug domain-containing protein, partial [Symploca sp. SIO2G7]|nr:TonB-dependent receptor plug domain-containing protein [Symploca sp. SIO2G7]
MHRNRFLFAWAFVFATSASLASNDNLNTDRTANSGSDSAPTASTEDQPPIPVDVITVTAQRREQNIQAVPIAADSFNQDDLLESAADELQDLIDLIPSAQYFDTRGAGQPVWVIRGVGLVDFNANNSPVTAIYYDDYYLSSNVMSGIGLFDIGNVEVLRGPQSGLYGRNTTGGAVRVNSARPEFGPQTGYFVGSYGWFDAYRVEGAFGSQVNDQLAFRLSAKYAGGGGYQDSLATPEDDNHGDRDFLGVRAQVLFAPSAGSEFKLKIEAGEDNSETLLARTTGSANVETGGLCQPVLEGRLDESQCFSFANANNLLAL